MNEENNVLTIKTVQIQPIRNMITAIKDILTDATITFTKEGIRIINFDKTHTILVNVVLHANKFEQYVCKPDKIVICANTLHLFKVISTMSNDDTLTMYIENCDYHDGVVFVLFYIASNSNHHGPRACFVRPRSSRIVPQTLSFLMYLSGHR